MAAVRVLGLAVLLVALACSAPERPLEDALSRAEAYFATRMDRADLGTAHLLGYLHRRFGLELHDAAGVALHAPPAERARPALDAVFRRLVDPAATASTEQIAALDNPIDRMTGLALHCDHTGLPHDWADALRRAADQRGYALTHAALASEWSLENGCRSLAEIAPVQHDLVERLVALASDRAALDETYRASSDLFIEALVMLYYLRAAERVEPAWLDALLEMQRPDGGWPLRPDASSSNPHPSVLAIWVLLENLRPDAPRVRWIP